MPDKSLYAELLRRMPWAEGMQPVDLMSEIDNRWDTLDPEDVKALFRRMAAFVVARAVKQS